MFLSHLKIHEVKIIGNFLSKIRDDQHRQDQEEGSVQAPTYKFLLRKKIQIKNISSDPRSMK